MSKNKKLIPELRFPEFKDDAEWEDKKLGDVGDIITGSTPNTSELINYGGDRFFVSPADISDNRYVTTTKTGLSEIGFLKTRQIPANSVLFVCIGSTIGKVAQNEFECATNQQINSVIPLKEYSSDFLYSALEYSASWISELAGIQAVPIINKTQFSSIKLIFPKLKEQQKIASCLSSLDELIAAHNQKLDLLRDHKKGLMQSLFPQEREKVPMCRFKEFEKDGEWKEEKLGDYLLQSPQYGINAPSVQFSKELPTYLRITDISEEGRFLSNTKVSVDRAVNKNNYLADGDVVLARTGASVGKSYKYRREDGELVFAGFLIRVRPNNLKLDSEFLFQFLATHRYWKWVSFVSARSGQPGINGVEYSSMPINLPQSIEEQQKIASCLSSLDELITAQAEKIEQLKLHKKGLMQGLFPK